MSFLSIVHSIIRLIEAANATNERNEAHPVMAGLFVVVLAGSVASLVVTCGRCGGAVPGVIGRGAFTTLARIDGMGPARGVPSGVGLTPPGVRLT